MKRELESPTLRGKSMKNRHFKIFIVVMMLTATPQAWQQARHSLAMAQEWAETEYLWLLLNSHGQGSEGVSPSKERPLQVNREGAPEPDTRSLKSEQTASDLSSKKMYVAPRADNPQISNENNLIAGLISYEMEAMEAAEISQRVNKHLGESSDGNVLAAMPPGYLVGTLPVMAAVPARALIHEKAGASFDSLPVRNSLAAAQTAADFQFKVLKKLDADKALRPRVRIMRGQRNAGPPMPTPPDGE
jgi:hypothetical protein